MRMRMRMPVPARPLRPMGGAVSAGRHNRRHPLLARTPPTRLDPTPRMTEPELRAVLLLHAFEQTAGAGWTAEDAGWAAHEARRQLGEHAPPEAWLARRAQLGLARLAQRQPALQPWLGDRRAGLGRALILAWLLLAALLGLLGEPLGAKGHIHLLAPPLLGLLVWNAVVYLVLLVQGLRRTGGRAAAPAGPRPGPLTGLLALVDRWWVRLQDRQAGRRPPAAHLAPVLARFGADWLATTRRLQAARAAALLHGAAALLVAGTLVSLYARGLVFDVRAGWDSTFLDAGQVRVLLGALLGPASALSGLALPEPAALDRLRLATGGGESAARWIHLWALTLVLAVLLPRLLLATRAAWQVRQGAADLPLPADDPALARLLRAAGGARQPVSVLPYSYQLGAPQQARLLQAVQQHLGPAAEPQLQPSLPLGAEDSLPQGLPTPLAPTVLLLFSLTATPERETHGAFVQALAALRPAPGALLVWVDESAFRQRLGGLADAGRLAQRRAAWQALLQGLGAAPQFVDLGDAPTAGVAGVRP